MSGRTNKKEVKKGLSKKTKTKVYNIFITSLTIVIMGGAMLWIAYGIYVDAKETVAVADEYQNRLPIVGDSISHERICMASDIYLEEQLIKVPSGNKMYYACSEHCVHQLSIDSVRFSIDPITRKKIDKAFAVVSLHPDKTGKIIYFESKASFEKYRQALKDR
ncbi:MAG: hypothetical protein ABI663_07095 [Chryseolinea sp.]